MRATREGFGDVITEIGKDPNVIVLSADLSSSLKLERFKSTFSERFIQCGISEQNMASVASGLALSGMIPFMTSFAVFSPGRNLDQIRTSIAYSKANVKIVSSHAGLTVGPDGATHQALEDIALMRTLPNMCVLVPADYEETKQIIKTAYKYKGPVYVRLGRPKISIITKGRSFKLGVVDVLKKGKDVTIVACGIMVEKALLAAQILNKKKIFAEVLNVSTIKPLDETTILKSVKKTKALVSAEEHQLAGGLGSVVSEFLSQTYPVPQEFIAVKDSFGKSGTAEELLERYSLTEYDIVKAVEKVINRKLRS